ncbi:MAG: flavodoxin-dependent (E)-4-hydroxy-3-methylbut-2-enyl-diphosphate synthase [Armatimonadetes bacterium]|nr:flavodoxin-dependent (E)-4-hydroxy-3-methylbut-2-enyl-diphosphate synthase [Armatimonadota bacterium]
MQTPWRGDHGFPEARRKSRAVRVGQVTIGGGAPISVQSMAKCPTTDVQQVIEQTKRVAGAGGQLMRVSVPDKASLVALRDIVTQSPLPIVADIHFDAELAIGAVEAGAAKIRINPGNIGDEGALAAVAGACLERHVPVRVGVNAGSLERDLLAKHGGPTAAALAESALRSIERMRALGVDDLVVSLKAADVERTVQANRIVAAQTDVPIHLGVTEAGPGDDGVVKSAIGIGVLLGEGIGDTIRVSLTAPPEREVRVGRLILRSLGLQAGPVLVSCPTCARTRIDVAALAAEVGALIEGISAPIVVAVMGCEVNGPGEAREADLGIAGGRERAVIFRGGKVVRTISGEHALQAFREELESLLAAMAESVD